MKLIDLPRFIDLEAYDSLKLKLINHFSQFSDVKSIYQLGSVNDPGISDLDILIIVDNRSEDLNMISLLRDEQYILTHPIFICKELFLLKSLNYTHFTNLNLIYGQNLIPAKINHKKEVEEQIALEFLLNFYISLKIQMSFKVIKVRAFLLQAKALKFDFNLLEYENTKLVTCFELINKFRSSILKKKNASTSCAKLMEILLTLFEQIELVFANHALFLNDQKIKIASNIILKEGKELSIIKRGLSLPKALIFNSKKMLNIQKRWVAFEVFVPIKKSDNSILDERIKFMEEMVNYHKLHFPDFMSLSTGLNIFSK
jgi:hypothetical protein